MDARAVDELRVLDRRDTELRERASRLRELDAAVAEVRAGAEATLAFSASYPSEVDRLAAAAEGAENDLARRRDEAAAGELALATARDEVERSHGERALERARDHVAVAEASLARLLAERGQLERHVSELPGELARLEEKGRALAEEAGVAPPGGAGAESLVEWASHAHAELFVTARQVDSRRELVIREANELASMLIGEPTYGSTVTQALERVTRIA
jgi:chromosome segregation ATPase